MNRRRQSALEKKLRFVCLLFVFLFLGHSVSMVVHASESTQEDDNKNEIYDTLKDRIENSWEKGMEKIEEMDAIEITGNIGERILRSIAAACYRNLRSIKAGALLIGLTSFVLGAGIALLARKDKKIRKMAVGICMTAIPATLLVFVFGISWFVSIFR